MKKRLKVELYMQLFAMKASYPLDEETKQEVEQLLKRVQLNDAVEYNTLLHESFWQATEQRGFMSLVYNDADLLVGALSALDLFGLNTYEWAAVVDAKYRRQGIGRKLVETFKSSLTERQSSGEMATSYPSDAAKGFLTALGYEYSSSEATLQAVAEEKTVQLPEDDEIRPYEQADYLALQHMMELGFSDLAEETEQLIAQTEKNKHMQLMMYVEDNVPVGTISTTVREDELWVTAFTVEPGYRRSGIGTTLLNWAQTEAVQKGLKWVLLDVELDNVDALRVYQQAGFVVKGQVDYYVVK